MVVSRSTVVSYSPMHLFLLPSEGIHSNIVFQIPNPYAHLPKTLMATIPANNAPSPIAVLTAPASAMEPPATAQSAAHISTTPTHSRTPADSASSTPQPQLAEVDRLKRLYSHVPKKHKTLLEREVGYSKKFASVAELIAKNEHLCHAVVRHALDFYHVDRAELDGHMQQMAAAGRAVDRVSVSQALKYLFRDWAAEGASERDAAFPCILEAFGALSPSGGRRPDDPPLRVALPGAGLGRLGHEVSRLGFEVTNNECSMYQNVVYRFLEAGGRRSHHGVVYPFVDSWSYHKTTSDMLRGVSFPDVPLSRAGDVVLVEGDFTTAFGGETAHFDVVVTHFFIDTARNLMNYFESIVRILKPGGY